MASATSSPEPGYPGARRGRGVEAVGGSDCCARPVAAAQCGFDRIAAHVVGRRSLTHSGRRAHQERIGAIRRGDGEDGVLIAQVAGAPCAFGPGDRVSAVEAVDVDHPEPDSPVVVELVDGLLHVT